MESNLERCLHRLAEGRPSYVFRDFARDTAVEWERMAYHLIRRWHPPCWHSVDDVVQDLLCGVHLVLAANEWTPSMGPSLSRYVVYNAMSHAKRELHRARGAKLSGTADKNPSRFEHPLSSFGIDGEGDAMAEIILAEPATAEQAMIDHEDKVDATTAALLACRNDTERAVILALSEGGDLEAGAEEFYADLDIRIGMRLVSEEHALRVVLRTVRTMVGRESLAS